MITLEEKLPRCCCGIGGMFVAEKLLPIVIIAGTGGGGGGICVELELSRVTISSSCCSKYCSMIGKGGVETIDCVRTLSRSNAILFDKLRDKLRTLSISCSI